MVNSKRGRPRIGEERMVNDAFTALPSKLQEFTELAKLLGTTKSALIREGMDLVIQLYKERKSQPQPQAS